LTNVEFLWYIRYLGSELFCVRAGDIPNIPWSEEVMARKFRCLKVSPLIP